MRINFSKNPSITYGNGNFSVDKDGKLRATGATLKSSSNPEEENQTYFYLDQDSILLQSKQITSMGERSEGIISLDDNPSFTFAKYETNGTEEELTAGIIYEDGNLSITGTISATEGNIGGWIIKKHSIEAKNGSLILYDDGRIMGADYLEEDEDDDGWLDLANKALNWKKQSGERRVYQNGEYQTVTDVDTLGKITTDLSGNLIAKCSGSAIMNGESSSSLIGGNSSMTVDNEKGLSVSKNGSKIFESKVLSTEKGSNGFLAVYNNLNNEQTEIYGLKSFKCRYPKEKDEADNYPERWGWIIKKINTNTKKYTYVTVSETEALKYWKEQGKSLEDMEKEAKKLMKLNDKWLFKVVPIPTQNITGIIGQPPNHVKMEKDGNNYLITETYDKEIFDGDSPTLQYQLKMEGEQVKQLIFPNGYILSFEGFDI